MSIDATFLESLLHEPEGTALDFKSAQYPFANADDGKKAELLKDILAFANSWRGTTAFILIGVKEIKGGRSEVVGVKDHLDDADLHQFVNGKTQRRIEFSYYAVPIEGTTIGVIEIPPQQRPFHLKKGFGKLRANDVYIRDGSSTRVASPDEIAKMGAGVSTGGVPELALEWARVERREVLPSPHTLTSIVLEPRLSQSVIAPRPRAILQNLFANANYPEDVIDYAAQSALLTSLGMRLHNTGGIVGERIRFVGEVVSSTGLFVQDWFADPPSKTSYPSMSGLGASSANDIDIDVRELTDRWEIEVDFGDVRPGDYAWTNNELFVGATEPCVIRLTGELRGDNLPEPIECELALRIEVERRAMEPADVLPYLDSE